MGILRFLLAITVVISHSSPVFQMSLVGGTMAVQAFYIISGFYISLILNEKYINENDSYRLFISNRLLRLFPVYWVVLLLSILFSYYVFFDAEGIHKSPNWWYYTYFDDISLLTFAYLFFTNIFLFFQDMILFVGIDTTTGNLFFTGNYMDTNPKVYEFLFVPQAWSIGVELLFYLIAPLILRKGKLIILLLFLSSLLLRLLLYSQGLNHDPWTYRFFPTELAFFLLGNLSYQIYIRLKSVSLKPITSFLVLFLILSFTVAYDKFWIPGKFQLYFGFLALSIPFIFISTNKSKLDNYVGELSYPIYISHILVLNLISFLGFTKDGLIVIIFTCLVSVLLNEIISKRVDIFRQNRLKTRIFSTLK